MLRGGGIRSGGSVDMEDGHPGRRPPSWTSSITDAPFALVAFLVLLLLGGQCYFTHAIEPEGNIPHEGPAGTPGVTLGWVRPTSSRYVPNSTFTLPPGVPRDLVDRGGLQVPRFPADVEAEHEKTRSLNDLPRKSPLGDIPKDLTFRAEMHGAQVLVHTLLATNVQIKETDVSWVTQLTTDRLDGFHHMLERWDGPVSATVYCRDIVSDLAKLEPFRQRVDFHLVVADLHPGRLYPVNTLRNVAMNKCRTQWMALVDADFISNVGLYQELLIHLADWNRSKDNAVYILPAFQLHAHTEIPRTRAELLALGPKVTQVHPEKGRDIAHKYVDYERWRTAEEPYEVKYHMPFEPYFVAQKGVVRYDVNFLGYGNDKTEHCYEVWKSGMKYIVLPFAFVFHQDHPRGGWLREDREWAIRGPGALAAFFADIEARLPPGAPSPSATPVPGLPGESCSAACRRKEMGCLPTAASAVNSCATLAKHFGVECGSGRCTEVMYGNDLPAVNANLQQCLVNSRPAEFPLACAASNPEARRLCPCGAAPEEWLNDSYVAARGWHNAPYTGYPGYPPY
mmetsp:Transcript_27576/g.65702  ORF Transcript_27576/g.65702 Transcript_27576/m.65702 type:complete len:566 (+) Transcript_27576:91-1788(+)